MNFLSTWLERFSLCAGKWRKEVRTHLSRLPFSDTADSQPLLEFLFGKVPGIIAKRKNAETRLLAEAYAWCCFAMWHAMWQCGSAFPSFPENYACHLKAALAAPEARRDPAALLLARMIVEFNAGDGRCGFNKLQLADAATIRESEALIHEGRFEFYLKAKEKYDEYACGLEQSGEFRTEWALIKKSFPRQCSGKGIIRRSLMYERNWERGPGAVFKSQPQRFQALFDLFCWKYFLWGMDGDKPLLLKTSVVFTPYGTQIFIPGYLSLDPKRDLNFTNVTKLHRARGIPRQGPGFSIGRQESTTRAAKAKAANLEASRNGLSGTERYQFICKSIGLPDHGDYRQLRKLLATKRK
ncbi:MAG: hypothetical protein WCK17_12425 [Verrucomicrobiota bacterium]